jgi:hypothetical protein
MRHAFADESEHVRLLNNDVEPLPGALDELEPVNEIPPE